MKKQSSFAPFVAEYRRIETDLRRRIEGGQWLTGAMLPSRRDLAQEYQVSSVTVGRAIEALVAENLLRADSRRGTFVSSRPTSAISDAQPRQASPAPMRRSGRIGIVAAYGAAPFSQDTLVMHAIEQTLSENGHVTSVCNRAGLYDHALLPLTEAIDCLLREGVAAVAVICLDMDRVVIEAELATFNLHHTPVVLIVAGELHLPIPHIFYDNWIGGYQAAKHLLDKGHREITVLAPFTASWVTERLSGIRQACQRAGLPPHALRILSDAQKPWDYQGDPVVTGAESSLAAFEAGWIPKGGIICVNDQVAFGLMQSASERGWNAGQDFALIGFDDDPSARGCGLTTVRPPLEAMGRETARLLLEGMAGEQSSHQLRLRAHLIPRMTTDMAPLT